MNEPSTEVRLRGWVAALWGIAGVSLLIGSAVIRLSPKALAAFESSWAWYHWSVLIPWMAFMLFSEGYRGFQQGFSPRVAARARWLRAHPSWVRLLLAPFFCMGFFGSTRKRQIVAWCLASGIVVLIVLVSLLDQPWRGIVDAGVVAGLLWGLVSLWLMSCRALLRPVFAVDPELAPHLISKP